MNNAIVSIVGLDAMRKRLDRAQNNLTRQTTAYAQSVAAVDRFVQDNFKGQGSKVGGWASLKESTIKRRRNKDKGSIKILQDTGGLRRDWKHLYDDQSGSLVSGKFFGVFHEKGTSKMVQRRILPTQKEMWPKIKEIFERFVGRALHD